MCPLEYLSEQRIQPRAQQPTQCSYFAFTLRKSWKGGDGKRISYLEWRERIRRSGSHVGVEVIAGKD